MIFSSSLKVYACVVLVSTKLRGDGEGYLLQIGYPVKSAASRRAIGIERLDISAVRSGNAADVQAISNHRTPLVKVTSQVGAARSKYRNNARCYTWISQNLCA